jgi:hypothetical protein
MHSSIIEKIREKHRQAFPNSSISFRVGPLDVSAMYVSFYLGKDKNEMVNGILQNDPLHCRISITVSENHLSVEPSLSVGSLKPTERHMAQSSEKIRTRKQTFTNEDAVVARVGDYFEKVKQTIRVLNSQDRFLPNLPYSISEKV